MLDQNTLATLITICATVFATVWVAAYNNRRAKERVAQEANRAKKVEAYHAFLDMLMRIFKSSGIGSVSDAELKESVADFIGTAMIYGSPRVIAAIGEWRAAADDRNKQMLLVDNLLREIRVDLGESNKGIRRYDLTSLFIIGGRPALEKGLREQEQGASRASR